MKQIFNILFTLIVISFIGCNGKNNPAIYPLEGKYSGEFTINQNGHVQKGDVTFTFSDNTYKQIGQIESPTTTTISEVGNYSLNDGNYIFNAGREVTIAVYPIWSLLGSFKYQLNETNLYLLQDIDSTRYEIRLQKIN
jgi:hypothetical protein